MLETIKANKVKNKNEIKVEDKVKEIKKASSGLNHKVIRRVLLTGVGTELIILGNYGYNFYKSGVGVALRLPYCNYIIPYWFLALAIISPTATYWLKWYKKLHKTVANEDNSTDLTSMWGVKYGNDK